MNFSQAEFSFLRQAVKQGGMTSNIQKGINEAKKQINKGLLTREEAIKKFDSEDNLVSSCKGCNSGPGGKHTKIPSSIGGPGKWVPPNPNEHVRSKIKALEKRVPIPIQIPSKQKNKAMEIYKFLS